MRRMSDAVLVLITAPSEDVAARLAHQLVEERLLACANLVPRVRSIYRWQGQVHDEPEALLVCKTSRPKLEPLKVRLPQIHPYETPELLAFGVDDGLPRYLAWLAESVA